MRQLSLGKLRGLQQCSTPEGAFSILALDHRNNLRQALIEAGADEVTPEMLSEFKLQVSQALAPHSSAVLLDPPFGVGHAIASMLLPGQVALISAVEATGYTGEPTGRESNLLEGWSVSKAKRVGANAIKLLVYYHPESETAKQNEKLVQRVAADCAEADIPLMVEPLSFSLDPKQKKLAGNLRREIILETAKRLTPMGVDILKAEFPLDIKHAPEDEAWADACQELSKVSACPWVLLSAGVNFETFLRQLRIACENGASGAAVGRAIWKESVGAKGEARQAFLDGIASERMQQVTDLCNQQARPWIDSYAAPSVDEGWYQRY